MGFLLVLISAALFIGIARGDENLYCCKFEDSSLCSWENVGDLDFEWTGSDTPDLEDITDFTSHAGNSVWLQDTEYNLTSGSAVSADFISPSVQLTGDDIISIEFYVHQVNPDGKYPITVYFDDDFGRSTVLALSKSKGWNQPLSSFCGGSNLCCVTYPCSGNLRVHGDIKNSGDLLAFDNILINDCPPPPTTTTVKTTTTPPPTTTTTLAPTTTTTPTTLAPTTLPPGPSSFCCSFETGCPTWTILGWTLSSDSLPSWGNITPFTYGSQYAWNEHNDAGKIISPVIYNVEQSAAFVFNYYVYTSRPDVTNTIIVFFKERNASDITYLNILPDSKGQWKPASVQCTSCCKSFPCDGQLVIEASIGPGENLFAIDNIEVNGGCVDSPKCCEFVDSDICGIINGDSSHSWKWSGSSTPNTSYIPDFTAEGNYLYYQSFSVTPNTTGSAILQTGLMTVNSNSTFEISLFVKNSNEQYPVTISFQRRVDGRETIMEFASDTYNEWALVTTYCTSLHGDCCFPETKCDGYLKISAELQGGTTSSSDVFFGVDSIDIDSECESVSE